MTQIATNKEQSARLIACGVHPKGADMTLSYNNGVYELIAEPHHYFLFNEEDVPAWSLSALLALMPKEITNESCDEYHISLAYERPLCSDYDVAYKSCWSEGDDLIAKHDPNPIEACVQMIEWLTANNYKLNNNG